MNPERDQANRIGNRVELGDHIDMLRNDPPGLVHALQQALNCDLTAHWGWQPKAENPEQQKIMSIPEIEDRCARITPEDYEIINVTADLVKFFCRFGILQPSQLGLWLQEKQSYLLKRSPLEVVFDGYPQQPLNKDNVRKVIAASQIFLRPPLDPGQFNEYRVEYNHLTVVDEVRDVTYNR